jgi:biopolymer transport protein TolR
MGMGGGGGQGEVKSEINVTPLVDVMLVLLTIFMVTAPFLLQSVKVKLPQTAPVAALEPARSLIITVQADGRAVLGSEPIELDALEARLKGDLEQAPEMSVQLRADAGVPYGRITEVMAAISRAGVIKLTFVTAAAPRSASNNASSAKTGQAGK